MSLLLFALALEPLAVNIKKDTKIKHITLKDQQHKILLYADDVLLYLESSKQSIPKLVD